MQARASRLKIPRAGWLCAADWSRLQPREGNNTLAVYGLCVAYLLDFGFVLICGLCQLDYSFGSVSCELGLYSWEVVYLAIVGH